MKFDRFWCQQGSAIFSNHTPKITKRISQNSISLGFPTGGPRSPSKDFNGSQKISEL